MYLIIMMNVLFFLLYMVHGFFVVCVPLFFTMANCFADFTPEGACMHSFR